MDEGPASRYEAREAVELAFVAALQQLPPRQCAVLVLCDVLGFSTVDAATMPSTGSTAVKGLLQRARATLDLYRKSSAGVGAPAPGSAAERDLAERFAEAFTAGDVEGVMNLLTDDAWIAMPPAPHEYHRPDAVAGFLRASFGWRDRRQVRLLPTRANRQPAYGCYMADPDRPIMNPTGIIVLTLAGDQVQSITRFLDGGLTVPFGLPVALQR